MKDIIPIIFVLAALAVVFDAIPNHRSTKVCQEWSGPYTCTKWVQRDESDTGY